MTEDGIRDLYDEDAEADAAVAAALVRQTADRAMHAIRRVSELRAAGSALAFGHITSGDGCLYIGRLTVMDGDEPLLVDWRARAAVPFYQATPLEPMGVDWRRNFTYGDESAGTSADLISYSDELFDADAAAEEIGLRGEAALLASITAPTQEQMRSVVATIQAEQDAVVRANGDRPLMVQGGPGTGKTVVALHRAAYLLYAQREALSDSGVLIIGPSSEFLIYIAGVLPSLGETGVVSVTAPELYPGVRRGATEEADVAAIKGRLDMAALLANAIVDRQRRPTTDLGTWYGARRVTLEAAKIQELFDLSRRHPTHNDGADWFRFELIEALTAAVYDPSFHDRDEARNHFRRSEAVAEFHLRHWPTLTPEQALNDLFGSAALLRSAARGTTLCADELALLGRPRRPFIEVDDIHWSNADIPLLDELLALVGISLAGRDDDERAQERDEADDFEVAAEIDRRQAEIESEQDGSDVEGDLAALDQLAAAGGPFDASVLDDRFDPPEDVERAKPEYFIELVEEPGDGWPGTGSGMGS
ncbi:MAG: hypothetical protein GY724_21255 [Actinomycetia bacterium]|nr:hypothetical protein [Actinomycetes bacterium]MCP5035897.1 hypothetical protein [Actinomycetes bacterium]